MLPVKLKWGVKLEMESRKICFLALSAYPLLSKQNLGYIVGPDVYQVLLAQELLERGFDVSFITYNEGGSPVEYINGIKVIKTYGRIGRSNLVSKTFHVWEAMNKAKADVYFQQGGVGAIAPLFCRVKGKRFVSAIASDAYVRKEIKEWGILFRLNSELEIKLTDIIVVQSEFQRTMLKRNFGKGSFVIRNPFPVTTRKRPAKIKPPIVLWVGSIAQVKQPELFLELARAVPETKFQMIAAIGDDYNYYKKIKETSKRILNLDFLGFIPFDKVDQYFKHASILVNTSKFEGFPNAFIQAWANYTPVVSLNSDPDEIICKYKLGFHSKTFNQLVEDVKTLLKDKKTRQKMGRNGRLYVEKEHNITKVVDKYIEIFNCLNL